MITTENSAVSYSGNNSTEQVYTIPFPFLEASHVKCEVTDSGGTITTLTDFSIVATKDGEGRNVTGEALTSTAIPTSSTIRFFRETPAIQTLDLVAGGSLPAEAAETAFDRATMIAQEARRDSVYSGTSNITASETGLVSQVSAGSFVGRTISPEASSPIAITNGDGVDGNPTIGLSESSLATASTLADADTFLVSVGGAWKKASKSTLEDSLVQTHYGTFNVRAGDLIPDTTSGPDVGAHTGGTIDEVVARFQGSQDESAYHRFFLPGDYNGGTLKLRLIYFALTSGTAFDWKFKVNADWPGSNYSGEGSGDYNPEFDGTVTEYSLDATPATIAVEGETSYGAVSVSDPVSIGSGYSAGAPMMLKISRDYSSGMPTAIVLGMQIQYPFQSQLTAWT